MNKEFKSWLEQQEYRFYYKRVTIYGRKWGWYIENSYGNNDNVISMHKYSWSEIFGAPTRPTINTKKYE